MAKVNDILNKYGVKRDGGRARVDTILGKYGVKPSSVSTPKQPESKSAVNPLMETMTSGRGSTGSVYNDVRVALFGPSALLPSRPRTTEERIKDAETSVTNWEKQVEEIKGAPALPLLVPPAMAGGAIRRCPSPPRLSVLPAMARGPPPRSQKMKNWNGRRRRCAKAERPLTGFSRPNTGPMPG